MSVAPPPDGALDVAGPNTQISSSLRPLRPAPKSLRSLAHPSSNASFRVLHVRCRFVWLGSFSKSRYFRAVFSSIPAFAAAVANVGSSWLSFINLLYCRSVTIQASCVHTLGLSRPSLKSGNFNCRRPGGLIVADHSRGITLKLRSRHRH